MVKKKGITTGLLIGLIGIACVSALGAFSKGFQDWNYKDWFKTSETQEFENVIASFSYNDLVAFSDANNGNLYVIENEETGEIEFSNNRENNYENSYIFVNDGSFNLGDLGIGKVYLDGILVVHDYLNFDGCFEHLNKDDNSIVEIKERKK